MPSPFLILTFCALLPASAEADMSPVLAPAILVEEASPTDGTPVELTEIADTTPSTRADGDSLSYSDLGPAVVVESN